jgi:hypothetical protein
MARCSCPRHSTISIYDHDIEKQTLSPYTPQQNIGYEHANYTIMEMVRNTFHVLILDKSFLVEPVINAVYIQKCCPSRALDSITLEKSWSGKRPCIVHMRMF